MQLSLPWKSSTTLRGSLEHIFLPHPHPQPAPARPRLPLAVSAQCSSQQASSMSLSAPCGTRHKDRKWKMFTLGPYTPERPCHSIPGPSDVNSSCCLVILSNAGGNRPSSVFWKTEPRRPSKSSGSKLLLRFCLPRNMLPGPQGQLTS